MDREQRVAGVVRTLQHGLELERLDRVVQRVGLARYLVLHGGVGLVLQQLGHLERPGEPAVELLPGRDPALERLDLLDGDPGAARDWPRTGLGLGGLERAQPVGLGRQVKESLGVR